VLAKALPKPELGGRVFCWSFGIGI